MLFARRTFGVAGIYGLLVITPQFFLETTTGRDYPPAVNHPEFYYGFVGTAFAFQLIFLVIARDPVRFRPLMLPSIVEKAAFGIAVPILYFQQRVPALLLGFSLVDVLLGILFAVAYVKTPGPEREGS